MTQTDARKTANITLLLRTHISTLVVASVFLTPQGLSAESIADLSPSLLAITIDDFEVGEPHDLHSEYWTYEGDVEGTVAGPEYRGEIKFVVGKATDLRRVFPAQFVLVFESENESLRERFGTSIEAIIMRNAEDITCFPFDLSELFSDDAGFTSEAVVSESSSGHCYKSSDLLSGVYP